MVYPYYVTLAKIDSNGNILWSKGYSDIPSISEAGIKVVELNEGFAFAVVKTISFSSYLVKTDSSGISGCNEFNIIINKINCSSQDSIANPAIRSFTNLGNTFIISDSIPGVSSQLTCFGLKVSDINTDIEFSIYPNPSIGIFHYETFQRESKKIWAKRGVEPQSAFSADMNPVIEFL